MKKTMKKVFKFFLFLIILICVVVGIFILLLTDNNVNEPAYLENADPLDFNVNEILSKGLMDTQSTKKIEFAMSEQDLSVILKTTLLNLNESLNSLNVNVVTAYVDIQDDNQMTFKAHFSAFNLMSSVTGEFSYGLDDDELSLSLNSMKVGQIGVSAALVTTFVNPTEINSMVNEQTDDVGIDFNLNNENIMITLKLSDVKEMLLDELGSTSDMSLYQTLLSLIFRVENMIDLTDSDDKLGMSIDVSKLCFDSSQDTEMPYKVDYNNVSEKIVQLLNNNIITAEDASAVGTYLVKGYNKLDGNDRSIVDNIDFSSIGITHSSNYEGILVYDDAKVEEIFASQVPITLEGLQNFSGLKLSEKNFNDILLQSNLVGGMFCFIRKEAVGYKVSYIAIESIYVDLKDNHFAIYLTMSLNGQSIVLNMEIDAQEAKGLKIDGTIESLRFGSEVLSDSETSSLLAYLNGTVNQDWIKIDSSSNTVDIDFTDMFSVDETLKTLLVNLGNIHADKQLSTKFVDGEILITL